MAKATVEQVEEVVQTVVTKDVVRLELSREEAQFIYDYLGNTVTGCTSGPRKHSDAVCKALSEAGVEFGVFFADKVEGTLKCNYFRGIQGGY